MNLKVFQVQRNATYSALLDSKSESEREREKEFVHEMKDIKCVVTHHHFFVGDITRIIFKPITHRCN